ncbi:DUF2975 domain-containing protein [Tessaracoccus lapidicaptus]|uniref:DUF2975 domain-containing protein n=1 Tax=Tessaracoccus lapidicaptus TaxID=1427523 RepID=UPI00333F7649
MGKASITVLRVIIAIALLGSLAVQVVIVPLLWIDMDGGRPDITIPILAIVVLGVGTLQVTAVCIWMLLTRVRRGTVFSPSSFRYVDTIIGAIATASVLTFGLAVVGAYANRTTPGDEIAPGLVGMICGVSLVIAGVALVVYVMRQLLAQAVAFRSELDEVI